jgi:DNA-binding response OmpR family regulator
VSGSILVVDDDPTVREPDGESRGRQLGAVGYVGKPVHADQLLSMVAAHVSGGRVPIG